MKKYISVLLCAVIFICCFATTISATKNEILPYYNNASKVEGTFEITTEGNAAITLGYTGFWGVTTGATITTKLQESLGNDEWEDVTEWIDEAVGRRFSTTHSYTLTERGTYRISVEYIIRGTGGDADVITETIEKTY